MGSGEPQTSEEDKKRGVSYRLFNLVEDLKLSGGEAAQQLEPRELGKAKLAEDLSWWCPTALETLTMPWVLPGVVPGVSGTGCWAGTMQCSSPAGFEQHFAHSHDISGHVPGPSSPLNSSQESCRNPCVPETTHTALGYALLVWLEPR